MTTARRSYGVNLLGTLWLAVMQVAFAPFFIREVGIEGYGLIGFSVTLQAVLQVLDFGFAPTISRWLARLVAGREDERTSRDFARTLEIGSWTIALVAGGVLIAAAGPIARTWFRHPGLAQPTLRASLIFMAVAVAAQWPVTFYQSGLLGLGRVTAMNAIRAAMMTASVAGAAIALQYARTVAVYFAVQAAATLLQAVVLRAWFWRALAPPWDAPPRFRAEVLKTAWRFAAGMTAITLGGVLVTQIDRIILSRLVPLEQFGYYALAWVVAGGLAVVILPAHQTLFPQFSSLFGAAALRDAFHRGAQMLSVLLLPLVCVISLFASAVIGVWTGDAVVTAHTAPLAAVLAVGTALNGLMHPPYALQLASGSTRLPLTLTIGQLVLVAPLVTVLTLRFGLIGAAYAWPAVNLAYLLVGSLWTFRDLLPGAWTRWAVRDVALPFVAALVPVLLARRFIELPNARAAVVVILGGVFACSLLAAVLAAPAVWRKL